MSDDALLDPIYAAWGRPAKLMSSRTGKTGDVQVIDETRGVEVHGGVDSGHPSQIVVQTISPCADMRWTTLVAVGFGQEDLVDARLTLYPGSAKETRWRVRTYVVRPGFEGEGSGEIRLVLEAMA